MTRPVTRQMVADEAGVSVTVVSYVINNNRYVDQDKRRRVEAAVEKLGYRPNAIARMLKSKRSNHILFVADQIDTEHFGKLLSEMDLLLYETGYLISLARNRDNDEFIQHIIARQIDGVIISSISMREQYIRAIAAAGIPVVLLMNRSYTDLPPHVGEVYPGLYEGASMCMRHLYATGCRDILYIDRMSRNGHFSDMSDLRLRGYMDETARLGLTVDTAKVITGCADDAEVIAKIGQYVGSGAPIDAIFARNDRMAAIAMLAVRQLGLRIPDDVSVVGFDNSNLSRYTTPSLTTVEQNRQATAQASITLLLDMIAGSETEPVRLDPTLVIRDSTRPLPAAGQRKEAA